MRRFSSCRRILVLLMLFIVLFIGVLLPGRFARATEGGGGAYANGFGSFMLGALPSPGTYFLDYLLYYHATSFRDKDGDRLMPKFDLNVLCNVFRLLEVTKYKIFGASWAMHVCIPVDYIEVDATSGKDHRSGIGDIVVGPLILGWHFKNFHITAEHDIYIPTGIYSKHRLTNTSRHYWTYEPLVALTYLADNGLELSGKFMYDINWKNTDTEYTSGQEFHVDYTVAYHVDKNLTLGAGGYYYQQTTDDVQNGDKVGTDGFKGRVVGLGPMIAYCYKNMSFTLKWQKDFEVENRPEGDLCLFRFMYAF